MKYAHFLFVTRFTRILVENKMYNNNHLSDKNSIDKSFVLRTSYARINN